MIKYPTLEIDNIVDLVLKWMLLIFFDRRRVRTQFRQYEAPTCWEEILGTGPLNS